MRISALKITANALIAAAAAACGLAGCSSEKPAQKTEPPLTPPPLQREFRGTWIPTVSNLCWPSKPGLSVEQQRAELVALLEQAEALNLNAVILQVRPMCDAFYRSEIEPWSEYLTGTQGQAPAPDYDPLAFAVAEAHARSLELHAWFNPYRVRSLNATSPVSPNHISERRPDLVRRYGKYLWLDPGEPDVQDYTLSVILDVVERYDIDAVHFDDYFYPYPEKNEAGMYLDFPDDSSWKRIGEASGLSRDDWRRRNVDQFVERVYREIHDKKPQIKFGISPFGIWRPKHPPTIEGLDAYAVLYADARRWLREGWCDYLAPQLYWSIDHPPTSFPILLDWWSSQNPKGRHIVPGLHALKTAKEWPVTEISRQIEFTRTQPAAHGEILWSATALMTIPELVTELEQSKFGEPALIPEYTWLDDTPPLRPRATVAPGDGGQTKLRFSAADSEPAWLWAVQVSDSGKWTTRILPGATETLTLDTQPEAIAVTAIDRCGNASRPSVLDFSIHD